MSASTACWQSALMCFLALFECAAFAVSLERAPSLVAADCRSLVTLEVCPCWVALVALSSSFRTPARPLLSCLPSAAGNACVPHGLSTMRPSTHVRSADDAIVPAHCELLHTSPLVHGSPSSHEAVVAPATQLPLPSH